MNLRLCYDFTFGLHSNIPPCCVIQFCVEQMLVKLFRLPFTAALPWRRKQYTSTVWYFVENEQTFFHREKDGSDDPAYNAQYWPCFVHSWLIAHRWCKPRRINVCGGGKTGPTCQPCPHCGET